MKRNLFIAVSIALFAGRAMAIEIDNLKDVTADLKFTAISPPLMADIQLKSPEFSTGNSEGYIIADLVLSTPGFWGIYKMFKFADNTHTNGIGVEAVVWEKNDPQKYISLEMQPTGKEAIVAVQSQDGTALGDGWHALAGSTGGISYNTDVTQKIGIKLTTATTEYHVGTYPVTIDVATFRL